MTSIEICLGSSCFARGGSRFPAAVTGWLAQRGLHADVRGRHCSKVCPDGPTVVVDGVSHQIPDEPALFRLLEATVQPMPDPVPGGTRHCMSGSGSASAVPTASTQA